MSSSSDEESSDESSSSTELFFKAASRFLNGFFGATFFASWAAAPPAGVGGLSPNVGRQCCVGAAANVVLVGAALVSEATARAENSEEGLRSSEDAQSSEAFLPAVVVVVVAS